MTRVYRAQIAVQESLFQATPTLAIEIVVQFPPFSNPAYTTLLVKEETVRRLSCLIEIQGVWESWRRSAG